MSAGLQHDDLGALLGAAVAIAREAGQLVAGRLEQAHEEIGKGHTGNLVTDVDRESEALIVAALRARFPDHAIVAEEGSDVLGAGFVWVVDPLDGTNNYAHGFPFFSVTLAALRGSDVVCGATYDPLRDELFTAARDAGAHLNGRPVSVSARGSLAESLVATGFPYDKAVNADNNVAEFTAVVPIVRGIRRTGSAALDLAYVAAGRLDAYWEHGTKPWDVAAGVLLVSEAGGHVTDFAGRPPALDGGRFVASNGRVHGELVSLLARSRAAFEQHPLNR